jgi:hypothetical protein
MQGKYKLLTINARGIKNPNKRKRFFKYLKQQKGSIISLQETNITDNHINIHKQSGATESFWTPFTAILLYTTDYTMTKLLEIDERAIIVDLKPKSEDINVPSIRFVSISLQHKK